ncbi:ulp1 protease family, C-terminal catalytic domain-containing protein [Tanacetum coccineum]
MLTTLKHVGNFKHAELKSKKFEDIQAMYEKLKRLEEINLNVVTRSNGQKRYFSTLMRVLSVFDREDLDAVYKLVMDIYQDKIPEGLKKNSTMALELIRFVKKVLACFESIDKTDGSNIIDLWSTILNDEEKYRGKQSVTRNIYCSTGMVDLNCDALVVNRHEVFFPCIKLSEETSNHYYLICFNMMTAEIDIIDNLHNDLEDLDLRYGPYAMALINSFIHYLEYIKHPKVDAFFSANPKILRMPWRTTYNAVDCGLFVMRHMKMYNGSGVWINNMKNEKEGQKSQINFFRAKYLAKILLLPYNTSKEELLKEANEKWKKQQNKSTTVTNMDVKVDKNLMKKFNETLQKAYSA